MDDRIKCKVQVAGAGAGKTYTMAENIVHESRGVTDHKKIYAITYTNAAKKNIIEKVLEFEGVIPPNLIVETVHTFFLNKIIYPNSKIILGEKYMKAVIMDLPIAPGLKQYKIKQLKEKLIIHNDVVFKKAKMILCKDRKDKKTKLLIDQVIDHMKASISKIFVDEAQDLDEDALKVFEILGNNGIYIYMVGDPKQALKHTGVFEKFVSDILSKGDERAFDCLPNNNITRRVPNEHLKISNKFCAEDQKQLAIDEKQGIVKYCIVDNKDAENLLNILTSSDFLIYISKKSGRFNTRKLSKRYILPSKIVDQIDDMKIFKGLDKDIVEKALVFKLDEYMNSFNGYIAVKKFEKHFGFKVERDCFAQLLEFQKEKVSIKDTISVYSIEKVKGLEADKCMYVVDDSSLDYIFGKKTERNKEYNKVYVALTRSKRELVLLADLSILKRYSAEEIHSGFKKLEVGFIDIKQLLEQNSY